MNKNIPLIIKKALSNEYIELIKHFKKKSFVTKFFLVSLIFYETLLIILSSQFDFIRNETGLNGLKGLIDNFDEHYIFSVVLPFIVFILLKIH